MIRFLVLATDYDGTLAHDGHVDESTVAALRKVRESGRKLVLVTGRELSDLQQVFAHLNLFDMAVVENGAVLHNPRSQQVRPLAEAPPARFVEALRARGVQPLSVGNCIVATWRPNEQVVLDVIRELGLDLHVTFNKGAVMVLPAGVNKGTGLQAALAELGFSAHNVVGIGDAENDHSFLAVCECSVAVANALPAVKDKCDVVTRGARGSGVVEVVEQLLGNDLTAYGDRLHRHDIRLATDSDGHPFMLSPARTNVLIAGTSGSGKTSAVFAILEKLAAAGYQLCITDPEGDYDSFEHAVALGDAQQPPLLEEGMELLRKFSNVSFNLLAVPLPERPAFLAALLPRIIELRVTLGRPHWLVLDEAHHAAPEQWTPAAATFPQDIAGLLPITVNPAHVAESALRAVDLLLAVGKTPADTIRHFADSLGIATPNVPRGALAKGEALAWWPRQGIGPLLLCIEPSESERRRHRRKYSHGDLQERAFVFSGPEGRLSLRAQNLMMFLQMAEGVDDDTWAYHLKAHDYSRWVRSVVKDAELADEIGRIEQSDGDPVKSRERVRQAINSRYTAPE